MFSEILNPFLYVRNKIKNKNGEWVDMEEPLEEKEITRVVNGYNRRVNDGEEETLLVDFSGDITIHALEVGGSTEEFSLRLGTSNSVGNYTDNMFYNIGAGSFRRLGSPKNLARVDEYNTFLGLARRNQNTGESMIYLKQPITIKGGCKLSVFGSGGVSSVISFKLVYSKKERV